jgi:UDP-glucose 4-epimerase
VSAIASLVMGSWGAPNVRVSFSGKARPGDPFSLVADPGKLRSLEFEWMLDPLEGISRYVEWFRSGAA